MVVVVAGHRLILIPRLLILDWELQSLYILIYLRKHLRIPQFLNKAYCPNHLFWWFIFLQLFAFMLLIFFYWITISCEFVLKKSGTKWNVKINMLIMMFFPLYNTFDLLNKNFFLHTFWDDHFDIMFPLFLYFFFLSPDFHSCTHLFSHFFLIAITATVLLLLLPTNKLLNFFFLPNIAL